MTSGPWSDASNGGHRAIDGGRAKFLPKFLATLPISAEQRALMLAHRRMDKVSASL